MPHLKTVHTKHPFITESKIMIVCHGYHMIISQESILGI